MEGRFNVNAVEFASFEGSKENIQPLKRGRNPHALKKAFEHVGKTSTQKHLQQRLIAERKQHEAAIQNYVGDDPLVPWLDYICWTQNAYPSGGTKSHLIPLLEKCTRQFKDDTRYRQNIRYLRCWLLYANLVRQPDDIFSFLSHKGIGVMFALFYETWAAILEDRKQFAKADKILSRGIQIRAQPLHRLKKALERIQLKVVNNIKRKMENNPMAFYESDSEKEDTTEMRSPLSQINHRRERIQNSRRGLRQSFVSTNSTHKSNVQLSIFHDRINPSNQMLNNVDPSESTAGFQIWNDYGSEASREKENRGVATPWNTGPLYPVRGRTEEERQRRQRRRERRRDKAMKKRREEANFAVFCDEPENENENPVAINYSRDLHNIEASHSLTARIKNCDISNNISTAERRTIDSPALAVQRQEKKEVVLNNNPLQYIVQRQEKKE